MQKIITFLILFSQFLIFGQQETEFVEITNIQLDTRPSRNVKLSDTLTIPTWTKWNKKKKERAKKILSSQQQDILRDSSKTSKIIFYGKAENLKLTIGDSILVNTFLNEISQDYFYTINDTESDAANYELVTINRNQGILEIQLFLLDSKRKAKFKIDTSFSEIYIHASLASENTELQNFEETEEKRTNTNESSIKPESVKLLEDFDRLSVHHRIPRKKHYW